MSNGFVSDYLTYTSGTEVPELFNKWAALNVLSNVANRLVFVQQGDEFTLYPNLFMLFIGTPGSRKSTAMRTARRILKESVPEVQTSGDSETKEVITQYMAEKDSKCVRIIERLNREGELVPYKITHYALYADELTHFLGTREPIHMADFLTAVYDAHVYEVKRKHTGNDLIIGPCLPLLACMTPAMTTGLLKSQILGSGFARRTLFIHSPTSDAEVAFPRKTPEQMEAYKRCCERAAHIYNKIEGEFAWTPEAEQWFIEWYSSHKKRMRQEESTSAVIGYLQTKDMQLLKIAMLASLSEKDELVMTPEDLIVAQAMLDEIEPGFEYVFSSAGKNEQTELKSEILQILKIQKIVPLIQLETILFKDAPPKIFAEVLEHMLRVKDIVKVQRATASRVEDLVCLPEMAENLRKSSGGTVLGQDST